MTAIQLAFSLGGGTLMSLVILLLFVRYRNCRVQSATEWPLDVYVEERRRWVKTLNDVQHRQLIKGGAEATGQAVLAIRGERPVAHREQP